MYGLTPAVRLAAGLVLCGSLLAGTARADGNAPAVAAMLPPAPLETRVDGLSPEALAFARSAYDRLAAEGKVARKRLTIIDYSKASSDRRMWVLDMESGSVVFHELVAHGRGSGDANAIRFGNDGGSFRTSLGVFLTAETYEGKHGYSLKLDGLEKGVNDRARERAIVIHAADYATEAFAKRVGRLGRSHGCPAVDPAVNAKLIDEIKGGSVVVAWANEPSWLATSAFARK